MGKALTADETAALAFGEALSSLWRTGEAPQLAAAMLPDAQVETPVWKCDGRDEFVSELQDAYGFFSERSPPTLNVLSHRRLGDGQVKLFWTLGLEWPAIWRPRINILGESTLRLTADHKVASIVETWHQSPREAFFSQALPKFRDWASLWATPTAEHLPMATVGDGDGYVLKRTPPMLALQAEWIETGKMLLLEQAPVAPAYAFTGEVKRAEWYDAVSPGLLERSFCKVDVEGGFSRPGQRRRWIAPLPSRYGADASVMPPLDDLSTLNQPGSDIFVPEEVVSTSVQYVRRPSQLLAMRPIKQAPSNELVLSTAVEIAASAERAGLKVARREGRPVIMQVSGDVKYGFNSRRKLSMCAWLSVPDALREEYVAVIIEGS